MTIYVDMDGVIADLFTEIAKKNNVSHWKEIPSSDRAFEDIKGTDFFDRIPKFSSSDDLIAFIDDVTDGKWCILSAPLGGDRDNCIFWKKHWLDKQGYNPMESFFTHRKEKYAVNADGTPNILIDDRLINIDRWIKKGGLGIRYQADEDSLEELFVKVKVILE